MIVSGFGYNQKVTYWAPTGESLYGAQNAFSLPVVMLARWEDRNEQVMGVNGVTFVTRAVVFVPQAVVLGGYLALGDYASTLDPTALSDAYEIKGLSTIPDLRNVVTERKAML